MEPNPHFLSGARDADSQALRPDARGDFRCGCSDLCRLFVLLDPSSQATRNQTLIRTSTGVWHVTYNAENRPVVFSNDTGVIEMAYD